MHHCRNITLGLKSPLDTGKDLNGHKYSTNIYKANDRNLPLEQREYYLVPGMVLFGIDTHEFQTPKKNVK